MRPKGHERLSFDESGNPFFYKTLETNCEEVKIQPSECLLPMLKELTVNIIIKRDFYSPTGEPRQWFGLQQLKIIVPNERQFRYHFLVFSAKAMSNICVKIVNPHIVDNLGNHNSISWDFNLALKSTNNEDYEHSWIQKVGKPVTISREKADILLATKEAIAVLNDDCTEQNVGAL